MSSLWWNDVPARRQAQHVILKTKETASEVGYGLISLDA